MTKERQQTQRQGDGSVPFGFDDIPAAEKTSRVRGLFGDVASQYDLMNDLMSGGIHRLWKAALIARLDPRPGASYLDIAGGTGDIALRLAERVGGESRIVVCDLTEEMLQIGRDRAIDRGLLQGIEWLCGDAESLPIADRSVDGVTVAFGLRNVTRLEAALAEVRRVLKPGGRFLCLEFSRIAIPSLSRLYDHYSFSVLPALGQLVAGNADAYRYLAESIRRFPNQADFARLIANQGLGQVRVRNLSGGIAALHSAWRL